MIFLLVGHRGTGKTHILKLLKASMSQFGQEVLCFDLDKEVETSTGQTLQQIFEKEGEQKFRELEEKTLFRFLYEAMKSQKIIFVSLGAGYCGKIPEKAKVIWIKRKTDEIGRIFLDRPRLDPKLSPLGEYFKRYFPRNQHYRNLADEVLCIPENLKDIRPWLPLFMGLQPGDIGGVLTLLPWQLTDKEKTREYISKRLSWGLKLFELRTDLLSLEQIFWAKEVIPEDLILLSLRGQGKPFPAKNLDWALELGAPPKDFLVSAKDSNHQALRVVSLHHRQEDIKDTLNLFSKLDLQFHRKLAVPIYDWNELRTCHQWWQEDPKNRSFLPISNSGRWEWYRLLHKYKMLLNFFREDEGSAPDQPYFSDWVEFQLFHKNEFGAILGDPVSHSWTPEEQRSNWEEKGCNPLRIQMSREEWSRVNFEFLKSLGLRFVAITSPLKELALQVCDELTEVAKELQSVNTIKIVKNKVVGHNTDLEGLRTVLSKFESKAKVAVWGGGGTLAVLKKLLPQADYFSARTGELRAADPTADKLKNNLNQHKNTSKRRLEGDSKVVEYDLLIWAVGRSQEELLSFQQKKNQIGNQTETPFDHSSYDFTDNSSIDFSVESSVNFSVSANSNWIFPRSHMSFDGILDLNYTENSPGKELALSRSCKYTSGGEMFYEQARLQKGFWGMDGL